MERSAIILAGGFSKRLGQDKGLVKLAGKPLILYVLEKVREVVDETIVVVSSENQKEAYSMHVPKEKKIFVDNENLRSPLIGALTGFSNTCADYSLLLPCDTPFVSSKVADLLFEASINVDAAVPRWPNNYIEPLQAVYRTNSALKSAKQALEKRDLRLFSMIKLQKRVRYLSTIVIQQIDPQLMTFFNINTKMDLMKARKIINKETAGNFI